MDSCLRRNDGVGVLRWLFSEESLMQAEPVQPAMKMYAQRKRATTRVAPTAGLSGLIFRGISHEGCTLTTWDEKGVSSSVL